MNHIKFIIFKLLLPLFLILTLVTACGYYLFQKYDTKDFSSLNYLFNKPSGTPLAGTGSMYPTLYWDTKEGGPDDYEKALKENPERVTPKVSNYFYLDLGTSVYERTKIDFGSIISFQKYLPDEEGLQHLMKRVIGLPGDTIELRDGFVIRNGIKLHEPYTNKPRSTFGNTFLNECTAMTVPENKFLVMGDNRKLSFDSRYSEVGLVDRSEIYFIKPFYEQEGLKSTWREITNDEFVNNKVTLNVFDFVSKLNSLRAEKGLKPISINTLLTKSALNRANFALDNNNFDYYDYDNYSEDIPYYYEEEIKKVGYSNILTNEYLLQGYYEAGEVIDLLKIYSYLEDPFLNEDFQDIGISAVIKEVNGCPTQVIVFHFGGYVPPVYSSEEVDYWQAEVINLTSSSKTWKEARGDDFIDQSDLEDLLRKFEEAISIAATLSNKMKNLVWLSDEDKQNRDSYSGIIEDINEKAEKINDETEQKINEKKRDNYEKCVDNWEILVEKKEDCRKLLD